MQAEEPAAAPVVRLNDVTIARGGRRVLARVDLAVGRGERLLVTGPNGAGKSTLLRVLAGSDGIVPGGGERRYALGSLVTTSPLAVRRSIATVGPEGQERFARLGLSLTVREIVGSGIDGTDYLHRALVTEELQRVDAMAAVCGIAELADRPAMSLSQGELRRTLLARALVARPQLLVLDEALEGLDASAHDAFLATLARVDRSVTIVLSSHRLRDLASFFDRIVVVDGGTVCVRPRSAVRALGGRPHVDPLASPGADRDARPRGASAADADRPLVSFTGVELAIDGRAILRDVTWCIRPGDHSRIVGANGSGKSTLVRALAGELAPAFGGRAAWFGRAQRPPVPELRTRIALVSDALQTRYERDETVRDVACSGRFGSIGLYGTPTAEAFRFADDALAECGLTSFAGERFARLSFGLRRRVLLARALATQPELLILDETLAGLDAETRERTFATLERLARSGTTIVVVAHHDEDVPRFVVRRLVLSGGFARVA